ncbi:MAG: hypothetical protein QM756_30785 [Polyangiaceae bacterium]
MLIDATAQAHLELVVSAAGKDATLLNAIDATRTPPGARLLRRWLLAPLLDVERIRRRLDHVELFVVHSALRAELSAVLAEVGDLERASMRASLQQATPRDLGALRDGLLAAARAVGVLETLDDPESRSTLGLEQAPDLVAEVAQALRECAGGAAAGAGQRRRNLPARLRRRARRARRAAQIRRRAHGGARSAAQARDADRHA